MQQGLRITLHTIGAAAMGGAVTAMIPVLRNPFDYLGSWDGVHRLLIIALGGAITGVGLLYVPSPLDRGTKE